MEIWMISIFACSAAYALLLTPLTIALARRIGAVDLPDARKIHDHAIPRLGGIAVFSSILLAAGTLLFIQRLGFAASVPFAAGAELILFPSLLMLCLGIVDDLRSL